MSLQNTSPLLAEKMPTDFEDVVSSLLSLANKHRHDSPREVMKQGSDDAEIPRHQFSSPARTSPKRVPPFILPNTANGYTRPMMPQFLPYFQWLQGKQIESEHSQFQMFLHKAADEVRRDSIRRNSASNVHSPVIMKRRASCFENITADKLYATKEISENEGCDGSVRTKAKRKRLNAQQIYILNWVFGKTTFPSTELRKILGNSLGLSCRTIQIWFQNKRQSYRFKVKLPDQQELLYQMAMFLSMLINQLHYCMSDL